MITKHTAVDQIEVTRNNVIQVRIALELVEGDAVIASKWHRTCVEPGGDVEAQMTAVNEHLLAMNEMQVNEGDIARIKAVQAALA